MQRIFQLVFSLLIGGLLLWLSFRHANIDEATLYLKKVSVAGLLLYSASYLAQWLARTLRWRIQLESVSGQKPPLRLALSMNVVSMAAVFFVPLRLGEFVRPYLCRKYKLAEMSQALAHSAVERVTDGIVTTAFLLSVLFLMPKDNLPDIIVQGAWIAAGIFFGGVCFLLFAYFWRLPALQTLKRLLFWVPEGLKNKIFNLLETFLDGISCFRGPWAFVSYLFYTFGFWALNGWGMWFLLTEMGLDQPLTAGFFAMCCLVLGVMVPAPPANVGNFEYAILVGLKPFGIGASIAAGYAFLLHTLQVILLLAFAVLILGLGEVSLAGFRQQKGLKTPEIT